MFDCPIFAPLNRIWDGLVDAEFRIECRSFRGGQIRHLIDRANEAFVDPLFDLPGSILRLTPGYEMLLERTTELVGREGEQIGAGVGGHQESLNQYCGPDNLAAERGAQVPVVAVLSPFCNV